MMVSGTVFLATVPPDRLSRKPPAMEAAPVSSTEGPSAISADEDTPDKLSGWSRWRAAAESRCADHLRDSFKKRLRASCWTWPNSVVTV